MTSLQEFIDYINSSYFDINHKWAVHHLIKDVVQAVDEKEITLEEQGKALEALFVRFGWIKKESQS